MFVNSILFYSALMVILANFSPVPPGSSQTGVNQSGTEGIRRGVTDCPTGFIPLDSKCFLFGSGSGKSWYDAQKYCVAQHSRLAVLNNNLTNSIVKAYLNKTYSNETFISKSWWLGGSDSVLSVNLTWSGSRPQMQPFTDWCYPEPNNPITEHCLCMKARSCEFRWNDAQCWMSFQYICEYQSYQYIFN